MMRQGTFWAYNLRPPESERERQGNVNCNNIDIAKTWKQKKDSADNIWLKERSKVKDRTIENSIEEKQCKEVY